MKHFFEYTLLIVCVFLVLTAFECNDEFPSSPNGYETMCLKDYSVLDGCSWGFQNLSGDKFEPQNLDDFSVYMYDGKRYFVKYTIDTNSVSICMIGKIIHIDDIIDPSLE